MEKEIKTINNHYNNGLKFKNIARKGDEFIHDFKNAAESFFEASRLVVELINNVDDKINFIVRSNASKNYYLYEANECMYSYEYKNGKFNKAMC